MVDFFMRGPPGGTGAAGPTGATGATGSGASPTGTTNPGPDNALPVGAYGDFATPGPSASVTLAAPATIRVTISSILYNTTGPGSSALVSVAVTGATTIAASNANCLVQSSAGAAFGATPCRDIWLPLNAGTSVITMKGQRDSGLQNWVSENRTIAAQP